jgi:hypothetical protein
MIGVGAGGVVSASFRALLARMHPKDAPVALR